MVKQPGHDIDHQDHLVLRLRLVSAVPLLLLCIFMSCNWENSAQYIIKYSKTVLKKYQNLSPHVSASHGHPQGSSVCILEHTSVVIVIIRYGQVIILFILES